MIRSEAPFLDEKRLYQLPMRWVPTSFQLADCLTKDTSGDALRQAMQDGVISLRLGDANTMDQCIKHGCDCAPPVLKQQKT